MKFLTLVLFALLGVVFAQSSSSGLTFAEFLNSQTQTADTSKTDTSTAKLAVSAPAPASYEAFLNNTEAYAKTILAEKEKTNSLKAAVNAETASPKDEFEKNVDYEKRLADFEKAKQQKILALEQEYQERIKETMGKFKSGIASKEDIQPDWAGMLKKDGDVKTYLERMGKFTGKISEMKERIAEITALIGNLELGKGDTETLFKHWQEKNLLYIARLEKACELMQDYILQEQAKVLSTDRKKFDMSLGAYNADNEEFIFNMNDSNSKTVPFNFVGTIKISPQQAKETNRQTDSFTASVDYINHPLIVGEAKLYPGVKKTHVFYKEQELPTGGSFKKILDLEKLDGYPEWLVYADSLLNGKLAPRNLDSLYAMKTAVNAVIAGEAKQSDSKSFWTGKNIFRAAMLGLSAASLGLGIWQNGEVDSRSKKMNKSYLEALEAQGQPGYDHEKYSQAFKKRVNDVKASENLRNGFYIGAGAFGLAAAVSFFF
ncbi:MAG: hypothetical protein LBQ76_05345 [Candidatus Fibromonas sp.]|jgi:hypothetical protein|nr:hypothetical protein [Candidatus Fibromonas sp.]